MLHGGTKPGGEREGEHDILSPKERGKGMYGVHICILKRDGGRRKEALICVAEVGE